MKSEEQREKIGSVLLTKYEDVEQYLKEYSLIPIAKEMYSDVITPITLLRKLQACDSRFFLLESVEGGENWARYSFLGYNQIGRAHV